MFIIRKVDIGEDAHILGAFSRVDGSYIGNQEFAEQLLNSGIYPQRARPSHYTASIGFCIEEEKWYGWSHRAMYGFGIGSKVEKGDCAYVATDWQDFLKDCIRFWDNYIDGKPVHLNIEAIQTTDDEGRACAKVTWTNTTDSELIPNEKNERHKRLFNHVSA